MISVAKIEPDHREPERRTWILAVVAMTLVVALGSWSGAGMGTARTDPAPAAATEKGETSKSELEEEREALLALGYLSATREATEGASVTKHDPAKAWKGLNFYTSGHGPEAVLMDMDGQELHRWHLAATDAWPKWEAARAPTTRFWRRAHLFDNGDLLAIFEGAGMIKVDRDSKLIWKQPNRAHHDLQVLENGDIWVLTRRVRGGKIVGSERQILEDFATLLDATGEQKMKVSILDAYRKSEFSEHWEERAAHGGDVMHTNSLELLDGSHQDLNPAFAKGNLLISMRNNDTIAVVDPQAGEIVWSQQGDWRKQHDPHLLSGGTLLLFDNGGEAKRSRILEFTPGPTGLEPLWTYEDAGAETFWSGSCGTAQRLPNGNTLVTESDNGRAFELDTTGEIVWEFRNPERPEDKPNLVAAVFENLRLPPDFPVDWVGPGE